MAEEYKEEKEREGEEFSEVIPGTEEQTSLSAEKAQEPGFWQSVSQTTQRGAGAVRAGTERLIRFAQDTTKRTRVKLETRNLQKELDNLYKEEGKKLWQLHKEQKLGEIENSFSEDFKKTDELEQKIAEKKKESEIISS